MRTKTKKYIPKNIRKRKRGGKQTIKKRGGRAIDAGSYGCVFDPPIKCNDNSSKSISYANSISKLMYKEDTIGEINEMKKVNKIIETIPNKEDYFIISNTHVCSPTKLQKEDLYDFDEKCRLFTKRGITKDNINDDTNLEKLALIIMPNGGLNIDAFIQKIKIELPVKEMHNTFKKTNDALIKLLINAIVPINSMRFNHYDIKGQNILYSNDGHARLIDWGLSGENDGIHIPDAIKDRSIAFNMPFSDIFFNFFVKDWLHNAVREIKSSKQFKNSKTGQNELLKVVAVNMINKSLEETSEGHYGYIMEYILPSIYKIYAKQKYTTLLDYGVLSYNTIIDYIHAVLISTYVDDDGNFNDVKYFYEVFQKNLDVWGFLMSYITIIEDDTGKFNIDVVNALCRILLKYCFSKEYAIKPIDINELVSELKSINDIIDNINKSSISKIKSKSNTKIKSNSNTKIKSISKSKSKSISKSKSKDKVAVSKMHSVNNPFKNSDISS